MRVIAKQPHSWFLVEDGTRLPLDVNCSHGAVSYGFAMELSATETEGSIHHGKGIIADLARRIQNSAPAAQASSSPYREKLLASSERNQMNAAIASWIQELDCEP
ncbi:hypothetical protein [Synechococcus sp. CBW1107]|uniref:hypothetical protein n=1 Tax=Synechococcus sp. CBW1107 TaxID=2789857 RepID=UPI002AD59809|nr:hypothetical protein [Synechococcus sp. CBW1107]